MGLEAWNFVLLVSVEPVCLKAGRYFVSYCARELLLVREYCCSSNHIDVRESKVHLETDR